MEITRRFARLVRLTCLCAGLCLAAGWGESKEEMLKRAKTDKEIPDTEAVELDGFDQFVYQKKQ